MHVCLLLLLPIAVLLLLLLESLLPVVGQDARQPRVAKQAAGSTIWAGACILVSRWLKVSRLGLWGERHVQGLRTWAVQQARIAVRGAGMGLLLVLEVCTLRCRQAAAGSRRPLGRC